MDKEFTCVKVYYFVVMLYKSSHGYLNRDLLMNLIGNEFIYYLIFTTYTLPTAIGKDNFGAKWC